MKNTHSSNHFSIIFFANIPLLLNARNRLISSDLYILIIPHKHYRRESSCELLCKVPGLDYDEINHHQNNFINEYE